jgi:hypothetical protein
LLMGRNESTLAKNVTMSLALKLTRWSRSIAIGADYQCYCDLSYGDALAISLLAKRHFNRRDSPVYIPAVLWDADSDYSSRFDAHRWRNTVSILRQNAEVLSMMSKKSSAFVASWTIPKTDWCCHWRWLAPRSRKEKILWKNRSKVMSHIRMIIKSS